ncbi:MAG: N-acetylmuramoyl-L-alanine amidase [Chloroflexia bacterium]
MAPTIENHPSPNSNSRGGVKVRAIVMHATAGTNSLAHLCDPAPGGHPERRVSAHDLITKTGKIYHLVDYSKRSFHAGLAHIPPFTGDANSLTIGIEIENLNNGEDPYPEAQLKAAVWLVQKLAEDFGIARPFVVTHAECALPFGRKTDPKPPAFNIGQFLDRVYADLPSLATTTFAVTGDGLRIRAQATTASAVQGQLNSGEKLIIDRIVRGQDIDGVIHWAHLQDGRGFVSMRFLRLA